MIDIGANLANETFARDLNDVLDRAREAGVEHIVVTATDLATSLRARDLCARYPDRLSATAGVHPHAAKDASSSDLTAIQTLLLDREVRAIGETGLDFNRDFSPRDVQERVFEQQLEIAAETKKPVFIHERDTGPRVAEILGPRRDQLGNVVIHCFTARRAMLERFLEMGCHIGITGWVCDERRGTELQTLVPLIPQERLLIETDAPYLMPRNMEPRPKGRARNEPAFLVWVARKIAELRGETVAEVARYTEQNARSFFDIPDLQA